MRFAAPSRQAADEVEATAEDIRVQWDVVLASAPDTVLQKYRGFFARQIEIDQIEARARLVQFEFGKEPYPPRTVTKQRFPGLWRAQS